MPGTQGGSAPPPRKRQPARRTPAQVSPIFGPVKAAPVPGTKALHDARRRAGRELAKAPGVRARLKPQPAATTPAARRRVVAQTQRSAANAGLTAADREALATTNTPAGRALRQAGRAQAVGSRRALALSGLADAGVQAPWGTRLSGLTPAQRRALVRQGLATQARPAREGRAPSRLKIGPASINLTSLGRTALAQTSLGSPTAENSFLRNVGNDVVGLGTFPVVAGLTLGGAAWDATHGRTAKAGNTLGRAGEGLAQAFYDSSPGYLARAGAQLAQGNVGAARDRTVKAGDAFVQHPVYELLNFAAVGGIAGRTAGGFARGAGSNVEASGVRGALARVGSPVRAPIALTADPAAIRAGAIRQRRYSMDSIRKGVQVAQDRGRAVVRDQHGKPVTVVVQGRRVPVLAPTPGEMARHGRKRGDFVADRANSLERLNRSEVAQADAKANRGVRLLPVGRVGKGRASIDTRKIKGDDANNLTHLVATGVIRTAATFQQDLLRRADQIKAAIDAGDFRHKGELKVAQANEKWLRRAASDPKVLRQRGEIVSRGIAEHARDLNAGDATLTANRIIDTAQAERSRLSEYALTHMDARHFTVHEHQALERAALKTERQLHAVARGLPDGPAKAAAVQAWKDAKRTRLAVAGRDVRATVQYERAQAHARIAKDEVKSARAAVESVRSRLHRHQGAAQQQRAADRAAVAEGRMSMKTALRRDAKRGKAAPADGKYAELQGLLKRAETKLRAAEKDYADKKALAQEAKRPDTSAALRHPDGRRLTNKEIEDHARAGGRDPSTLAYVPHVASEVGNRAYHQAFQPGTRPRVGDQVRTGTMFRRGATAIGSDVVRDAKVHKAVMVTKAQQLDRLISDSGMKLSEQALKDLRASGSKTAALTAREQRILDRGGYFTAAEADELAKRLEADGKGQYIAVRAHSAALSAEDSYRLQTAQSPAAMETAHLGLLNDRVIELGRKQDRRARNVVLMPLEEWNRLTEHAHSAGDIEKIVQMMNAPFRMAVLPQARWLTGNFVEPMFVRLPLSGAGINVPGLMMDVRAFNKVRDAMKKGTPEMRAAWKEIEAQQLGGLFIGNRGASVRRTYADFAGADAFPGATRRQKVGIAKANASSTALYGLHVVRHLPIVKQLIDLAVGLANGFFGVNRVLERQMQKQSLGRDIRRDVHAFTGSWLKTVKLGGEAAHEAAQGLVSTATQQRYMEAQHELLGKYGGFGPKARRLIQTFAPFLPWTLAAARFVYWTMPAHHTVATAALLKISQSVQDDWDKAHAGSPPDLGLASVRKDGGLVDFARYTPYGLSGPIAGGNLGALVTPFAPQVSGALSAVQGRDPFGKPLKVKPTETNPKGTPTIWDKLGIAGNSLAGSTVLGYSMLQRFREGGGTGYGNSNPFSPKTKPGSKHMSAANRIFNPFRPTYLRAPVVAGSGGAVAPAPKLPKDPVMRARIQAQRAAQAAQGPADETLLQARRAAAAILAHQGGK